MTFDSKKKQPGSRSGFYQFARVLVGIFTAIFYPCSLHNAAMLENLDAPYILISNHQSMMDPVLIASKLKRYEIRFVGKRELTRFKPLAWVVKNLHMIAISRHESDLSAIRAASAVLKQGEVLGIFPEGGRKQGVPLQHIESGAAILALRNKVPLLPVLIAGRPRPFHKVKMIVGPPIPYDDLLSEGFSKEVSTQLDRRIQQIYLEMYNKNKIKTKHA